MYKAGSASFAFGCIMKVIFSNDNDIMSVYTTSFPFLLPVNWMIGVIINIGMTMIYYHCFLSDFLLIDRTCSILDKINVNCLPGKVSWVQRIFLPQASKGLSIIHADQSLCLLSWDPPDEILAQVMYIHVCMCYVRVQNIVICTGTYVCTCTRMYAHYSHHQTK